MSLGFLIARACASMYRDAVRQHLLTDLPVSETNLLSFFEGFSVESNYRSLAIIEVFGNKINIPLPIGFGGIQEHVSCHEKRTLLVIDYCHAPYA